MLEKRNDEMYSSRFFRQYNVQKQNLKKLKEIVGLKKCLLSNRIVLETRCSEFDFIDYLKEIEIKGMKQRRVIEILKGNTDQLRWQDRLEKSWDEIEGIDDRVFLEKLGEGIRRCVSEGYLADKFRDSYIQDTAERLVVNIQRKIKG